MVTQVVIIAITVVLEAITGFTVIVIIRTIITTIAITNTTIIIIKARALVTAV